MHLTFGEKDILIRTKFIAANNIFRALKKYTILNRTWQLEI